MILLKNLMITFFISVTMLSAAPVVAGEGATQTLSDVISLAEETLKAMVSGADNEKIAALLKETKQASKSIVISGPADLNKQRASSKIKKSRKAFRAGNMNEAIGYAEEGLDYYKKAKATHFR